MYWLKGKTIEIEIVLDYLLNVGANLDYILKENQPF